MKPPGQFLFLPGLTTAILFNRTRPIQLLANRLLSPRILLRLQWLPFLHLKELALPRLIYMHKSTNNHPPKKPAPLPPTHTHTHSWHPDVLRDWDQPPANKHFPTNSFPIALYIPTTVPDTHLQHGNILTSVSNIPCTPSLA